MRWPLRRGATPTSLSSENAVGAVRLPVDPEFHGLLPAELLPADFRYPPTLLHLFAVQIVDLEPWSLLVGEELEARSAATRAEGGRADVVPFAVRRSDGLVAVLHADGRVLLLDAARTVLQLDSVDAWLRSAVEDFLAHDDDRGRHRPDRRTSADELSGL